MRYINVIIIIIIIPVHVFDCIKNGHRICVVLTSDTEVIVTLLYYMPKEMVVWLELMTLLDMCPFNFCMNDFERCLHSFNSYTYPHWMRNNEHGWYKEGHLKC